MSEAKTMDQVITPEYAIYQGDCIDVLRGLPDASVHYSIFSPPFVGLYKFSNFDRDMSNSDGNEFWEHFTYLINELMRLTKPGRICSVHVMNLPRTKTRDGAVGMYDFRGDVIRAFENADWIHHSEVCIFKDPVIAQQRTKSIRLLHKQITKDSTISGQGLADYIVSFRKPGENAEPVDGMFTEWHGAKPEEGESWSRVNTSAGLDISREAYDRHAAKTRAEGREPWPFDMWVSVLVWQRYASPVWMDIDQTNTLQYRNARDEKDEQHISPLQLDVIERCIDLWSNPGDVVLTPFLGIGSEVYSAVKMGRRGIGIELKPSYFQQAVKNIASLENEKVVNLFSAAGA